jgi:hypothetical protein
MQSVLLEGVGDAEGEGGSYDVCRVVQAAVGQTGLGPSMTQSR